VKDNEQMNYTIQFSFICWHLQDSFLKIKIYWTILLKVDLHRSIALTL